MTPRRTIGTCVCCGTVGELAPKAVHVASFSGWVTAGYCQACLAALPRIMAEADRASADDLERTPR